MSDRRTRTPRERWPLLLIAALVGVYLWQQGGGEADLIPRDLAEPAALRVTTERGPGSYRFSLVRGDGSPVRWDPCEPVRYVVNASRAPYPTAVDDVRGALRRVTDASGITFEYLGQTDEVPDPEREPILDRYGDERWAPVLVAWTDPGQVPDLEGTVVGSAQVIPAGREAVYVSGAIYLDATERMRAGFGTGGSWGTVLLHEAGHLAGLGHVESEGEVMHPGGERNQLAATIRFGPGDGAGLDALGLSAGCEDVPAVP